MPPERLDGADVAQDVDGGAGQPPRLLAGGSLGGADHPPLPGRQPRQDGEDGQPQDGEERVDDEQHDQRAAEQQDVGHERRDGDHEGVEHPPHVGGQPVADLARPHPVVPAEREREHVGEDAGPQCAADAFRRALGRRRGRGVEQFLGDGEQHHRPGRGDQQRRRGQLPEPTGERPLRGQSTERGVDGESQRPGAEQRARDLRRGGDGRSGEPAGLGAGVRERQPPQARGGAGGGGRRAHAPTLGATRSRSPLDQRPTTGADPSCGGRKGCGHPFVSPCSSSSSRSAR